MDLSKPTQICQGLTKKGASCKNKVAKNERYCWLHKKENQGSGPSSESGLSSEPSSESEVVPEYVDGQQYVYALVCLRFYGQLEGVFLTLQEIETYLINHPKQPTPPKNMFTAGLGKKKGRVTLIITFLLKGYHI